MDRDVSDPTSEPDLVEYRSLLFRASHAQRSLLHPFMAAIGLGTGQPKLLSYLNHYGSCSQRELADYYELDPAGVSRALDALERKGFVTFEQNADDRRAKVVVLTTEGERVAQSWDAACREEAAAMLEGFAPAERRAFADYLARAHANLRAYSKTLSGKPAQAPPGPARSTAAAAEPAAPAADPAPAVPADPATAPAPPSGAAASPHAQQEVSSHA